MAAVETAAGGARQVHTAADLIAELPALSLTNDGGADV